MSTECVSGETVARINKMPAARLSLLTAALALLLSGVGCSGRGERERPTAGAGDPQKDTAKESRHIRPPAVAGLFYPFDQKELSRLLDGLLQQAPAHYVPRLRALI